MTYRQAEADYINEAIAYEPEGGIFLWRPDRPAHHFDSEHDYDDYLDNYAGEPVRMMKSGLGYKSIYLMRGRYYAHVVTYVCMSGNYPPKGTHMDHKDRNPKNNRWSNLRPVSSSTNCRNRGVRKDNTTGYTGVSYAKNFDKYRAQVFADGKNQSLGYHDTIEEASAARQTWMAQNGAKHNYSQTHGL